MLKRIMIISLCCWLSYCFPLNVLGASPEPKPAWAALGYYGRMTQNTLGSVLGFNFQYADERLYALELAYRLSSTNLIYKFLAPIVSSVELTGNFTYRDDPRGPIYEVNPYLAFRWENFPWNKVITNTLAIGWGTSYDSRVPTIELEPANKTRVIDPSKSRRLLNYLMFEATVALPSFPRLQLAARIHHRSGIFGLYKAGNSGSTAVGLGLRYWF